MKLEVLEGSHFILFCFVKNISYQLLTLFILQYTHHEEHKTTVVKPEALEISHFLFSFVSVKNISDQLLFLCLFYHTHNIRNSRKLIVKLEVLEVPHFLLYFAFIKKYLIAVIIPLFNLQDTQHKELTKTDSET